MGGWRGVSRGRGREEAGRLREDADDTKGDLEAGVMKPSSDEFQAGPRVLQGTFGFRVEVVFADAITGTDHALAGAQQFLFPFQVL